VRKIIIDTDPGIDDAVAIMFALGSGQLELKAITIASGNLLADRGSANARKILELVGAEHIPVSRGMQSPLVRAYPKDPFSHGDDGLGNLGLPEPSLREDTRFAPDLLIDTVNKNAGDISILGIAPLTNLALAVMKDPELPRKVQELIIVGGAYGFDSAGSLRATGDNPVSEWNIYVDPEAASIVFNAGFNLTAIGLDVATHASIAVDRRHRETLASSDTKAAWFLNGIIDFVESRGFGSYCTLIDSLAVAVALDPTLIDVESVRVGIETRGELTVGQTVVDRRENFRWEHLPLVKVASAIDSGRFFELLLRSIA
jgi:inosine-uridine nucleoside N-ribohydrolase